MTALLNGKPVDFSEHYADPQEPLNLEPVMSYSEYTASTPFTQRLLKMVGGRATNPESEQ
jgi:hypothetical protein